MPLNDQDARALTYLARRLREETLGAGKWDEVGIYAVVSELIGQHLATSIERVTGHAADSEARTPGAIRRPFVPPSQPMSRTLEHLEPAERCRICSKSQADCERYENHLRTSRPDDAHDFEPDIRHPKDYDIAPVITELKGHLKPRPAAQPAHTPGTATTRETTDA